MVDKEYKKYFDTTLAWVLFATRPWTLFGTSLWYEYYASDMMQDLTGTSWKKGLFIERPGGLVGMHREKGELTSFMESFEYMVLHRRDDVLRIVNRGFEMNDICESIIQDNKKLEFSEAIHTLVELTLHATSIPYMAYMKIGELSLQDEELVRLLDKIRSTSVLFVFLDAVVMPLVKERLHGMGVGDDLADHVLYRELLQGDLGDLQGRLRERRSGKLFIYQNIEGEERLSFVKDTTQLTNEFAGLKKNVEISKEESIMGSVAYQGVVCGKVRIATSWNDLDMSFDDGDILVATSTNPNLVAIMKRAGAFVTDEGGIMSHASIMAREMKKPCIIGTKIATKVLKDGDEVEVDADKGVVRLIKKS